MITWQRHRDTPATPDPEVHETERLGSVIIQPPASELLVWVEGFAADHKHMPRAGSITLQVVEVLQEQQQPGSHAKAPAYYATIREKDVRLGSPTPLQIGSAGRYVLRVSSVDSLEHEPGRAVEQLRIFTRTA